MPIRHEEDDRQRTTEALDREWRADHEHASAGAAALARWCERGPAVLAALARLAPTEDLAARTPLQAFLPGLVHMTLRRFAMTPTLRSGSCRRRHERLPASVHRRLIHGAWSAAQYGPGRCDASSW